MDVKDVLQLILVQSVLMMVPQLLPDNVCVQMALMRIKHVRRSHHQIAWKTKFLWMASVRNVQKLLMTVKSVHQTQPVQNVSTSMPQ